MEKLFGMPVFMTFPNDYTGVHHALTLGKQVNSSSALGSRISELAEAMAGKKPSPKAAKRGLMGLLTG
jgi:hypothetical protein